MKTRPIYGIFAFAVSCLLTASASAGTANGNDLARELTYCKKGEEKKIEKDAVGQLFFFRYLRIDEKKADTNSEYASVAMKTQEPSSDMIVEFVVDKTESLKLALPLEQGQAIAVTGRVKTISKKDKKIYLDPVIVRYAPDRLGPKLGKELLNEVDKTARYGTDTSSGNEVIIKKDK